MMVTMPAAAVDSPHRSPSPTPLAAIGKSGRVIEKLTLENERLRRELNSEKAARQDIEANVKATKALLATRSTENTNLIALNESSNRIIGRRDRQIEELKAALAAEAARREAAEEQQQALRKQLDETTAVTSRELARAKEEAGQATANATVLIRDMKILKDDFEIARRRIEDHSKKAGRIPRELERLDALNHQKQSEMWNMARTVEKMQAKTAQIEAALNAVQEKERLLDEKLKELNEVCDKMRWVMRLRETNIG